MKNSVVLANILNTAKEIIFSCEKSKDEVFESYLIGLVHANTLEIKLIPNLMHCFETERRKHEVKKEMNGRKYVKAA